MRTTIDNMFSRVLFVLLVSWLLTAPAFATGVPLAGADTQPAFGRYLVTLTDPRSAEDVARAYGGRLEPFAADDVQAVMMVLSPEQARKLGADARVVRVAGQPLAQVAPPAGAPAPTRTPRSDWAADGIAWSSGEYAYDGVGNIKQVGNDVYRYDAMGRLSEATAGTVQTPSVAPPINRQVFAYDQYGNLKSITTTTRDPQSSAQSPVPLNFVRGFAVNPATNQLDGQCDGQPDQCLAGTYDPAGSGNQTGLDTAGQYTWDALGMMTTMAHRGEQYVYDANDERIVTIDTINASTARYTLRGMDNKVTRELIFVPSSNTWALAKDYVYRGGALIASFSSTQTEPDRHYHLDHLGSTRVVTDGTGIRLATHTYWPFGLEADGSETDSERLKFTGHERDSSPDGFTLDYMHARYYNPNLGRFLSVDPGGYFPERPQSWNRYTYALNNPVLNTDPDGRCVAALPCPGWLATGTRTVVTQVGSRAAAGSAAGPVGVAVASAAITGWQIGRGIGTSTIGGRSIDSYIQGALVGAMSQAPDKSLDEVLVGSVDKVNRSTGTTILTTTGTYGDALQDFNDVVVADTISDKGQGVLVGTTSDGKTVVVRPRSSDGPDGSAPTLEVQDGKTKTKQRYREREDEPSE